MRSTYIMNSEMDNNPLGNVYVFKGVIALSDSYKVLERKGLLRNIELRKSDKVSLFNNLETFLKSLFNNR